MWFSTTVWAVVLEPCTRILRARARRRAERARPGHCGGVQASCGALGERLPEGLQLHQVQGRQLLEVVSIDESAELGRQLHALHAAAHTVSMHIISMCLAPATA